MNRSMLEGYFLSHFKGEDHPVTRAQLGNLRQRENGSTHGFIHKWEAMAYKCSDVLLQISLVDICHNNLSTNVRSMIMHLELNNLGELLEASLEEAVTKDLNSQKPQKRVEPSPVAKEVKNVVNKPMSR